MLKIVIGNKAYSSWSLRGWLAVKHSGLPFEEQLIPMNGPEFEAARGTLLPAGQVPVLWDGDTPVWDTLAITDWLADRVGRDRYWPAADDARALARSMSAEMHSGFGPLRQQCGMNVRRSFPGFRTTPEVEANVARIEQLWTQARTRFGAGGPYLFGAFGAADIMYSAVATRFHSYHLARGETVARYVESMMAHPWMVEWVEAAKAEPWVIEKYEL